MQTKYIIIFLAVFFPYIVNAQCSEKLLPEMSKKLDTYIYVKDFKIKLKKVEEARDRNQITIPVMLNKNTKYRFVVDDAKEYEGRLVFELFSDRGKQLSSYVVELEKHYPILDYHCNTSGMYYLNFEFKDDKGGCGVVLYGFAQ